MRSPEMVDRYATFATENLQVAASRIDSIRRPDTRAWYGLRVESAQRGRRMMTEEAERSDSQRFGTRTVGLRRSFLARRA